MLERANLLGAIVATFIYASCLLVFTSRLLGRPEYGHWLGYVMMLSAAPLVYLLLKAPQLARPPLYYLQIGLMLAYLLVELALDYVLKLQFRQVQWMVIGYVMLFFAGTGGMLGVASQAGRAWTVSSGLLFLAMAILTFWQRAATGM
jgi:hypothetical protein